jgi:hypothetical protein
MIRADVASFELNKCSSCGIAILFSRGKCSCDGCGKEFCPACIATKTSLLCPVRTHGFFCQDCITPERICSFRKDCLHLQKRPTILGIAIKLIQQPLTCPECKEVSVHTDEARGHFCLACGWPVKNSVVLLLWVW